jgi:hypothetical protein
MATVNLIGIHLLPSTGEFAYDIYPAVGWQRGSSGLNNATILNFWSNLSGNQPTDYTNAIEQFVAEHPECTTVSLVIAWLFNTEDASTCNVYPTTNFLLGQFEQNFGGGFVGSSVNWMVSGLTQADYPGIIPGPTLPDGNYVYGGTPSDPSVVRCIRDLKSRGFKVVFYPFLLGAGAGFPWRGRITSPNDLSQLATNDVNTFMGNAAVGDFTPDSTNLTVSYSGGLFDWTYRRMILHYANLCTVAGGVNLFLIASELRGLEILRGPNWTEEGDASIQFSGYIDTAGTVLHVLTLAPGSAAITATEIYNPSFTTAVSITAQISGPTGGVGTYSLSTGANGNLGTLSAPVDFAAGTVTWDYPMVAALKQLGADVRTTFDNLGFTKNLATQENLIVYSADWSSWMGWQHTVGPGGTAIGGQWPHLDQLFSDPSFDFASLDNYLPLTDWTTPTRTGAIDGGLDALEWQTPAYTGAWPPPADQLSGLGLTGPPTIYNMEYIKGNIEGGQYFNWFYNSGSAGGHSTAYGIDPNGTDLRVTLPEGDRLAQARNPYYPKQELLANKQLRWWWNNSHQAVYDDGDGTGFSPHGPPTLWVPNSKSIIFMEFGVPAVDRGTNQPNVFYDAKSSESATPFWSIWDPSNNGSYFPRRDDTIQAMAIEALYEYWNLDGNNETVGGLPMLVWTFCCAWNWDARPFPTFPINDSAWGDTQNWQQGDWLNGIRLILPPPPPTPPPGPGTYPDFPSIATSGWSVHVTPKFSTLLAQHVSGRETRGQLYANPLYEFELTYEVLRSAAGFAELQAIVGFFAQVSGQNLPFWFSPPVAPTGPFLCRFAEDVQDFEEFMTMLWTLRTVRLMTVRP